MQLRFRLSPFHGWWWEHFQLLHYCKYTKQGWKASVSDLYWCDACILPGKFCFWFPAVQKSSLAPSPLTSASLAPVSKVYKGLQTHCCCCSSSIPRANSRISWHWTLQRGRAWKHTHTTHHFAWITNHQLNDCAHFSGTLLSMWLIWKQWNGTPCVQTSQANLKDLFWCVKYKDL